MQARRLWMAFILGLLASFGPFTIDMYLPAFPIMADDFETTISNIQLSLTACLFGLAIGQLFAGPLSDIYGRRKPLLIGLITYVLSSLFCALSNSIWGLILFRFLQGVSGASGIVIARAIVRDLYSGSQLTKFFALLMLVSGAAPIFAPIFGGQLLKFVTWHGVFVVLSFFGLFMFLLVLFGLRETLPKDRRAMEGIAATFLSYRNLFKDRVFIGYAFAQSFVYAAMFSYISGSPFVLQNIYGLSPQQFSLFFAINGIGLIIATQTTGRLAGKIHERNMLIFGLGLASLSSLFLFCMILLKAHLAFILMPLFFVISSVGIIGTTCFSLAMQNQGRSAGRASALLGVLSFIFGAIVAPVVGISQLNTAFSMGLSILICNLSAMFCYFFIAYQKEKKLQ